MDGKFGEKRSRRGRSIDKDLETEAPIDSTAEQLLSVVSRNETENLDDVVAALYDLVLDYPNAVVKFLTESTNLMESLASRAMDSPTTDPPFTDLIGAMTEDESLLPFAFSKQVIVYLTHTLENTCNPEIIYDVISIVRSLISLGKEAAHEISRANFLEICFNVMNNCDVPDIPIALSSLFGDFCAVKGFCPYCLDRIMECFSRLVRVDNQESVSTALGGFVQCSRYHSSEFLRYIQTKDSELCSAVIGMSTASDCDDIVMFLVNVTSLVSYEYRYKLIRMGFLDVLDGILGRHESAFFDSVVDIVHNLIVNDADEYFEGDDGNFEYYITEAVFPFARKLFTMANDDRTLEDKLALADLFAAVTQYSDDSMKMEIIGNLGFVRSMCSYIFASSRVALSVVSAVNALFEFLEAHGMDKQPLRACILEETSMDEIEACFEDDDPAVQTAFEVFQAQMQE